MKTIGEIVDTLYEKRTVRLALEKQVEELKQEEKELAYFLKETLEADNLTALRGTTANFSFSTKIIPKIMEWPSVVTFIREQNAFELCYKQIAQEPWNEYRNTGIIVPGTSEFEQVRFSITKIGKKK